MFSVAGHPAADASATLALRLEDGDDVRVALTSSSLCGLMANPYSSAEIWDADDVDGPALGVTPTLITSGYYFWLQTWGYCACLVDVAGVIGQPVKVSDGTDGATELLNRDATDENDMVVGVAAHIAAVSGDYGVLFLQISP